MTRDELEKGMDILKTLEKAADVERYIKKNIIDGDHPICITAGNNRSEVVAFGRLRDSLIESIFNGIENLRHELNKEFEEL